MTEIAPKSFYGAQSHLSQAQKGQLLWSSAPEYIKKLRKTINTSTLFKNVKPLDEKRPWGIFSYETTDDGKRTFFPAVYDEMFEYFCWGFDRHYYEVIEYLKPCHLYYDVEYMYAEKNLNGDEIVKNIIEVSQQRLLELFGIDDTEVILLGTDSKTKFSRHMIIKSKTKAFYDNFHVGRFVRENILVYPEFAEIVDQGVYSKNRCFRLIWNSKRKKSYEEQLIPIDGSNASALTSNAEFFKSTLISYAPNRELVGYEDMLKVSEDGHTRVTNVKEMPGSHLIELSSLEGLGIEDFVLKSFDITGKISKCDYNESYNTIIFGISGCRYCRNIGREHKSNGIYIVCKLTSGVAVQRCYDPDCRFFESDPITIPEPILDKTRRKYDKMYKPKDNVVPVPEDIPDNHISSDSEVLPSEVFKDGIAVSPSILKSPLRPKPILFEQSLSCLLSSSDEEIIIDEEEIPKKT